MQTVGIIVPVTRMAGKLQRLNYWLHEAKMFSNVYIYIVHDKQDEFTAIELSDLVVEQGNPRITIIECEVGNPGQARNVGLALTKEDWIVFWDSDDHGKISKLMEILDSNQGVDVIICNFEIITSDKLIVSKNRHARSWRNVAKSPGIWRFIFKQSLLGETKFSQSSMGEDQLFLARLNLPNCRYAFSDETLYQYVANRKGSLTNERKMFDLVQIIQEEINLLRYQKTSSACFTTRLILFQCVSLIKYGNQNEKKAAFKFLGILLLRNIN